jgi:hypothetical protein
MSDFYDEIDEFYLVCHFYLSMKRADKNRHKNRPAKRYHLAI